MLEVDRATLSESVAVPWCVLESSVSELGELGPPLVERLLRDSSARICAAFEHVRLIRTNYKDQASQHLGFVLFSEKGLRKACAARAGSAAWDLQRVHGSEASSLTLLHTRASEAA